MSPQRGEDRRTRCHSDCLGPGWLSAGNDRSFSVVRVPSKEEEQLRSITRQRQSLIKERSRNTNRRRSYALYYGVSLKGICGGLRETGKSWRIL